MAELLTEGGYTPRFGQRVPFDGYDLILIACGDDLTRFETYDERTPVYRVWAWAQMRARSAKPRTKKPDD